VHQTDALADCPLLVELAERRDEFVGFVRRRAGSAVEPQEIVQRALLRAGEHAYQLRDRSRAKAWFYMILRRTLADAQQEQRSTNSEYLGLTELSAPEERAVCNCSLKVLETLPAQYAEILRCVDVTGEPLGQVAVRLGTSANNAGVRLHRARRAMRASLKARCGTTSSNACQSCRC